MKPRRADDPTSSASNLFQISIEPYSDFDISPGEERCRQRISPIPSASCTSFMTTCSKSFVKNGITYVVQSLPENATSTLESLKSWQFI